MRTSDQIDKLAEALAKAQGQMKNPETNKTVTIRPQNKPAYSYNYADLPQCLEACRKPLADNGICYPASIIYQNGVPLLVMRLIHSSGQWIESEYPLPRSSSDKELASGMTYGKRYLLCNLVGISADDDLDSDANRAEDPDGAQYGKKGPAKPKVGTVVKKSFNMNESMKEAMAQLDSAVGQTEGRNAINRDLLALYKPFLKKFPGVRFPDLLTERYQVSETRLMKIEELSDLVAYMRSQLGEEPKDADMFVDFK
jgi:hypothetical protein